MFLTAAPLRPGEQDRVAGLLPAAERTLFHAQRPADQRHGYQVMRHVAALGGDELVRRAALLHDVGKAATRLGAAGRSLATVCDAAGLPRWRTAATYVNHGEIGARWLEEAGSPPLVVDFARRHPDPDPGDHDPRRWRMLIAADHG